MQLVQLYVLETGRRVQVFLDSQAAAVGILIPASLRAQLDAAVSQCAAAQAEQAPLGGSITDETAIHAAIRQSVNTNLLRPIATAARHALRNAPDFTTLVAPKRMRKGDFAATVTAVADAAAKYEQTLIGNGVPADFIARLRAAVAQVQTSTDNRALLVGRQSGATESADEAIKTIRGLLKVINSAVTQALQNNRPLLANWVATKRIQATVVTPLPGGDASVTAATPAADTNSTAKPAV